MNGEGGGVLGGGSDIHVLYTKVTAFPFSAESALCSTGVIHTPGHFMLPLELFSALPHPAVRC
jgi:hypothetical protein